MRALRHTKISSPPPPQIVQPHVNPEKTGTRNQLFVSSVVYLLLHTASDTGSGI